MNQARNASESRAHAARRSGPAAAVALAAICLLAVAGPAPAAVTSEPSAQLREDLNAMVDEYAALVGRVPVHSELLLSLESARESLAFVPEEQFAAAAPALGPKVAELRRVIGRLRQARAEALASARATPGSRSSSPAFPAAPYPDLEWNFFIEAFGDDPDDAPGDDVDSGSDAGVCSLATVPNAAQQFTFLELALIGEAARDTARRLCDQIVVVLGAGANVALVCIATDILFLVVEGIKDNELLCSANVEAAEVTGTYNRLEHLHDDLAQAEAALTARIDTAESNLTAEIDVNEVLLADLDGDLVAHDLNLSSRADQIDGELDAQAQFLRDFQAEVLRLEIEAQLASRDQGIPARFMLPQALGGLLEEVRQVVATAIANTLAAGERVLNAEDFFAEADARLAEGAFEDAYEGYGRAYRQAVQVSGRAGG